jgi:hypothetical protein
MGGTENLMVPVGSRGSQELKGEEIHEPSVPLLALAGEQRFEHTPGQVVAEVHDPVGAPIDWFISDGKVQLSIHNP